MASAASHSAHYTMTELAANPVLAAQVHELIYAIHIGDTEPVNTKLSLTAVAIRRAKLDAGLPIVGNPTPAKFERFETHGDETFAVYSGVYKA